MILLKKDKKRTHQKHTTS